MSPHCPLLATAGPPILYDEDEDEEKTDENEDDDAEDEEKT